MNSSPFPIKTVTPGSNGAKVCPIRDVLARIGDRWSILVLLQLAHGTIRFSALRRVLGDISQRMLAQTLRTLQEDGFVARKVYPTVPPKVAYSLTGMGETLVKRLVSLADWAATNQAKVHASRRAYKPVRAVQAL